MANLRLGWDKLRRLLTQPNTWTGQQTFTNAVGILTGTANYASSSGQSGTSYSVQGGIVKGLRDIYSWSTNGTTADNTMIGYAHIFTGTGTSTISVSTAGTGYNVTFMCGTSGVLNLDPLASTDKMRVNGTLLAAGNKITSDGSVAAKVYIECVQTGIYDVTPLNGIWIDGGA